MTRHYGEDAVKAEVSDAEFRIYITNHHTGATIRVVGPIQGAYETKERRMSLGDAENLGREIAHLLRKLLI